MWRGNGTFFAVGRSAMLDLVRFQGLRLYVFICIRFVCISSHTCRWAIVDTDTAA